MTSFLQVLLDALSLGSLFALTALGIGLLFGILRLINFAHGEYVTVGAYSLAVPASTAVTTTVLGTDSVVPVILLVTASVLVLAVVSDRLVFKPLRTASASVMMIASFALSYVIQNLLIMIHGGRPKALSIWPELTESLVFQELRVAKLQLVVVAITAVTLVALVLFLKRSRFGIQLRAASEDFKMSCYLGVQSNKIIAIGFIISGILAAIVSLLLLSQTGVLSPGMGANIVLYAFIATIIGGLGSLLGSVLGGFVIGMASTFLQTYLPLEVRSFRDAFLFALVILFLVVRPQGIVKVKALQERV
ncbi:branched-chain amino acid ABC transporter permease [Aminobacter aminovorans]|uniref:Branched-chain amino acid transport system permease protein n=1 Tax=Aminobacter aminovorans TaxID=83263 RepID=A0AAC8YWC9_AMIAI|nr:branched-chain amino acid ABC transporter permease [Aminobacter aminovorans]AMS45458.1 High-affinity branched-chain amino acid ABC transporter permease protein [Aminobacter aminovorans]MBB3708665.1 branched-chain amino acid transport system permease protein [Aminobacter aminovorans]